MSVTEVILSGLAVGAVLALAVLALIEVWHHERSFLGWVLLITDKSSGADLGRWSLSRERAKELSGEEIARRIFACQMLATYEYWTGSPFKNHQILSVSVQEGIKTIRVLVEIPVTIVSGP